jgi:hypothetical protein
MVKSLVDGGYWARMKYLLVFATEINDDDEALINWIDPGTHNADDPTTTLWTQYEGYTGDGVEDYISTNYTSTATQNDASAGVYIRNNFAGDGYVFGDGDPIFCLRPRNSGNGLIARVNSSNDHDIVNVTTSVGFWIISRTGANAHEVYFNGASLEEEADASTGVPSAEFHIFHRNGGASYTTHQVSIFWVMDSADDTDASALNTIFETYMDAIGKGVQP